MKDARYHFLSFVAIAGFILSFQLVWAKSTDLFSDIFLRALLSGVLAIPAHYLLLHAAHLIRCSFTPASDITGSYKLLLPFSAFHLEWFVYVSERPSRYALLWFTALWFFATIIMFIGMMHASRKNDRLHTKYPFAEVNQSFVAGVTACFKLAITLLSRKTTLAGVGFYPSTWTVLSMSTLLFVKFSDSAVPHPAFLPVYLAATILLPVLFIDAINLLTGRIRLLGHIIVSLLVTIYGFLTFFYVTEGVPFDLSLLTMNSDLLSDTQSFTVLADRLQVQSFIFFGTYLFIGVVIFFLRRTTKQVRLAEKMPFVKGTVFAALTVSLLSLPLASMDPVKACVHSLVMYRAQEATLKNAAKLLDKKYPYMKDAVIEAVPASERSLPDIYFICLESMNGMLIGQKTGNGKALTPFLDSLIPQGVYIEQFYGNSIQTARGFFTILSGTPPGFRKKESVAFPDLAIRGLPGILADYGYETYFMKAYRNIDYDNTGDFTRKAGYAHVTAMADSTLTEEEKKHYWGWGLQDDYFYRKVFSILDTQYYRTYPEKSTRPPLFLTTFNVSHHLMFQKIPEDQKYIFPKTGVKDVEKNFRNSIHLADQYLRTLFDEIDKRSAGIDPLIIIVGDHGYPSGTHSIRNEKGSWEENFRIPFLVIWKNHLKPARITGTAYSQIDIMPTVFDLLSITPAHHSPGMSIFSKEPRKPVTLSQPYDGISLVSILYPYKLVRNLNGRGDFLFDVKADPLERDNRIKDASLRSVVDSLQTGISMQLVNQVLIEQNRLWKK